MEELFSLFRFVIRKTCFSGCNNCWNIYHYICLIQWLAQASMLWRKRVTALASEYPDVELSHMYVDNAAMQLVRNPKQVRLVNLLA